METFKMYFEFFVIESPPPSPEGELMETILSLILIELEIYLSPRLRLKEN